MRGRFAFRIRAVSTGVDDLKQKAVGGVMTASEAKAVRIIGIEVVADFHWGSEFASS
jgi:hypothetical protein